MADVRVPDSILPGEIIRIDYRILSANEVAVNELVHSIKQAIASDPRFDYQSSRQITVGDLELGRDIQMLSIYAKLREKEKQSRAPITYVSMSNFEAYIKAAGIVWSEKVAYVKATIVGVEEWAKDVAQSLPGTARNVSVALLLIGGMLAYAWFFGVPKRGD
jgi:hypothetical protein